MKNTFKSTFFTIVVAVLSSLATVYFCNFFVGIDEPAFQKTAWHSVRNSQNLPDVYASPLPLPKNWAKVSNTPNNFIRAAQLTTPAVVHIKTENAISPNPFSTFWGNRTGSSEDMASGSGVIVSSNGFIVTNKHVISGSKSISVILNNQQSYKGQLIGEDPSTDIALIKIDANGLTAIRYGDSDSLQVGEWVLAVGNPFNLTSTVTAGIVSAKGRNINILQSQNAIEAFIQTDAAVNPGNSGGALVNVRGELVGINTAIASNSGTYSGYSFAVPVSIVRKVVEDLKNYGIVQSASLGIGMENLTSELIRKHGLNSTRGVLVQVVASGGAGSDAGLQKGDLITEINGIAVSSIAELQEKIVRFSPGDEIVITYLRNEKAFFPRVKLKNQSQTTGVVRKPKEEIQHTLGAEFEEISILEIQRLGLRNGLKLVRLYDGLLRENTTIREGFLVDKINNKVIFTIDDIYTTIKDLKAGDAIRLEGLYDGEKSRRMFSCVKK